MILEQGEKIHLIVRRNFDDDLRRHFVGRVLAVAGSIARVEGYAFILDAGTNQYIKRPEKRIRLVGLGDAGNIIFLLPYDAILEEVKYIQSAEKRLVVTDGKTFSLDINEFGTTR